MATKPAVTPQFEKIQAIIAGVTSDVNSFDTKGNGAAGTRVRKAMQELKTLAQGVRETVSQVKNK